MKYYSENDIKELVTETESNYLFVRSIPLNIRLCRECEYFVSEHPTIAGVGYCTFHTEFDTADDIPNWWLCDKNDFCNGDWIN